MNVSSSRGGAHITEGQLGVRARSSSCSESAEFVQPINDTSDMEHATVQGCSWLAVVAETLRSSKALALTNQRRHIIYAYLVQTLLGTNPSICTISRNTYDSSNMQQRGDLSATLLVRERDEQ